MSPTRHPFRSGGYRRKVIRRSVIGITSAATLLVISVLIGGGAPLAIWLPAAMVIAFLCAYIPVRTKIAEWEQVYSYQAAASQNVFDFWVRAISDHEIPVEPASGSPLTPHGAWSGEYTAVGFRISIFCRPIGRDLHIGWILSTDARPLRRLIEDSDGRFTRQESANVTARPLITAVHNCMIEALDKIIGKEGPATEAIETTALPVREHLDRDDTDREYEDILRQVAGRDAGKIGTLLSEVDIRVYLADGGNHAAVESALDDFIGALHIEVLSKEDPELGSWFRRMKGKVTSETPSIETVVEMAVRVAQMKTMLWPQAGIDAAQGDTLAKLISSLGSESNAVVQIGSILIVKINGNLMCRNLTQAELAYLERSPILIKNPDSILRQLQDASAMVKAAEDLCSCGSGRPARECHLTSS